MWNIQSQNIRNPPQRKTPDLSSTIPPPMTSDGSRTSSSTKPQCVTLDNDYNPIQNQKVRERYQNDQKILEDRADGATTCDSRRTRAQGGIEMHAIEKPAAGRRRSALRAKRVHEFQGKECLTTSVWMNVPSMMDEYCVHLWKLFVACAGEWLEEIVDAR